MERVHIVQQLVRMCPPSHLLCQPVEGVHILCHLLCVDDKLTEIPLTDLDSVVELGRRHGSL